MLKAHRIALEPNNKQATYFSKACGVARFAYNWALNEWQNQYEKHKNEPAIPSPTQGALRRLLNSIKHEQFPWMLEVTKNAPQMAIIQLGQAFKNFFSGRAKYPRFRKKGIHDRFTLTNDQFTVAGKKIRIPNLGWVRMQESLRFSGKIISATISQTAGRWFVSVTVEVSSVPKSKADKSIIGVDLGISALAALSNGEKVIGRKPHKVLLSRLKKLSKALSRKIKGSRNRAKAKTKLARLHARIANIRLDAIHKFTTEVVDRFNIICIEDLSVQKMMKNRHLSRSIADMGFREIRRQLEYKASENGARIVIAGRYFPSSKMCSYCGHVLEQLPLLVRQWTCPMCKSVHDRDINAAKNLAAHAVSSTALPVEEAALA